MNVLWWLQAILTVAEIAGAFFFKIGISFMGKKPVF